jgi:small-conductance mechanosensitive channel
MNSLGTAIADLRDALLRLLADPAEWVRLGALVGALAIAWLAAWQFKRWQSERTETAVYGVMQKILAPLVLALGAWLCIELTSEPNAPYHLLHITRTLALWLAGIRLFVFALERILRPGPVLVASERLIAWSVWVLVALYLLGWIAPIMRALEAASLPFGIKHFTLLDAARALLTLLVTLLVAAYLGTLIERRVMGADSVSIGVRVGVVKFAKLALIVVASLIAIDSSGINIAALQVFGGALGVGLGFGLQRIASNFVSGFILIGDRSIRQGDVITIGDRFGVVTELRARYVVVRDRDNVDTLIPNEQLISSEVVNWSYGDRNVRLKLPVQISYNDNPRNAMALLVRAATDHARVLTDPMPVARVKEFADNGINLELRFWIRDPEDGINNVRSDLYLAVWDYFKQAGITIPYPQRDLHLRSGWAAGEPKEQE